MANTNRSSQTQQMFRVVERYYRSGLSRRQICEQEEISLSKLNYWINRYRREKHFFQEKKHGFTLLNPSFKASSRSYSIELELPDGVVVRISTQIEG